MRFLGSIAMLIALGTAGAAAWCANEVPASPVDTGGKAKNWSPPAAKIFAQALADDVMAKHAELKSVTLHGVPPGLAGIYTMFAGSYPERIGNPDDPDDIDVITKGITIIDPRWHRTKDAQRKFVVQLPLRDVSGDNVGLLVLAYKNDGNPANDGKIELYFFRRAVALRDALERQIPGYAALFEPATRHPAKAQ